jgi:hypothetical protein
MLRTQCYTPMNQMASPSWKTRHGPAHSRPVAALPPVASPRRRPARSAARERRAARRCWRRARGRHPRPITTWPHRNPWATAASLAIARFACRKLSPGKAPARGRPGGGRPSAPRADTGAGSVPIVAQSLPWQTWIGFCCTKSYLAMLRQRRVDLWRHRLLNVPSEIQCAPRRQKARRGNRPRIVGHVWAATVLHAV